MIGQQLGTLRGLVEQLANEAPTNVTSDTIKEDHG